jgi:hypothetical protein
MRYLSNIGGLCLLVVVFLVSHSFRDNKREAGAAVTGVFEGKSPGVVDARPFLQIPLTDKCDFIKWKLTFLQDNQTGSSSTFKLEQEYGYYPDNRTDKTLGKATIEGKWETIRGTKSKPDAVVYRLTTGQHSISFMQLDNNLLHLLNTDKSLMNGDGGQGFTLSRTDKLIPPMSIFQTSQVKASLSSGVKDTVLDFIGRTPCKAVSSIMSMSKNADCFKLKWALKLHQDPVTFKPTTYQLQRIFRERNQMEGTWSIVKGASADPDAVIYKLDAYDRKYTLYMMKGGDSVLFFLDKQRNLLVGNHEFCYTLNRRRLP